MWASLRSQKRIIPILTVLARPSGSVFLAQPCTALLTQEVIQGRCSELGARGGSYKTCSMGKGQWFRRLNYRKGKSAWYYLRIMLSFFFFYGEKKSQQNNSWPFCEALLCSIAYTSQAASPLTDRAVCAGLHSHCMGVSDNRAGTDLPTGETISYLFYYYYSFYAWVGTNFVRKGMGTFRK